MIPSRLPLGLLAALLFVAPAARGDDFDARLDALPIVDEIDAATTPPIHQFPENVSRVAPVLGRPARLLGVGDEPRVAAWVIGAGKGLKAGAAYLLEVEYPDDVPRAIFIANRGADHVRGFATGTATGDARQQFVQPSLESLAYPQSGRWQVHRSLFFLHDRFQGLYAQRDPKPGGRPFAPADGFHVVVFQTKRLNDPRSEGAAIGRIRLRAVPDPAALDADVEFPPAELPRRRVFYREEMADETISAPEAVDRGVADPVDWYVHQAKICRILGINTFAKDLLEFGFNQGWESGDPNWVMNARPPLVDLWDRLVPRLAAEGLDLLPYFEYKGALGMRSARSPSLGWQRRAEKLYHDRPNTRYTGVWWTERHNADLTDPDTLADARRLLDRAIIAHKDRARFVGAWFRTRDNHLPISFAEAAIARFRNDSPEDGKADRDALVASYEGDRKLYDRYVAWWLGRRAAFLDALADHLARGLGNDSVELLFTPWTGEQIPQLRDPRSGAKGLPVQLVTDDPTWWDAFARRQTGWFRWALAPTSYEDVVKRDAYAFSLRYRAEIKPPDREEHYHSAPSADPERLRDDRRVMATFPIGRLFTVESEALMDSYRSRAGLTAIHHHTLNEDNHDRAKGPSNLPFDGRVGYVCADVDRAGPHVRLLEARAVAKADPTNLGMLCGSAFSTGFPAEVRRFNRAFLAVPALPSRVVPAAADPEVVVREIPAGSRGTYYLLVNTSMRPKPAAVVTLPAAGTVRDLVDRRDLPGPGLRLDLEPGELRSYRILSR